MRTGSYIPSIPPLITKGNLAGTYLSFFEKRLKNNNTRRTYERALKQFFAWCDTSGFTLESISPEDAQSYFDQHSGSTTTLSIHRTSLKIFFDWLREHGSKYQNPFEQVAIPTSYDTSKQQKDYSLNEIAVEHLLQLLDSTKVIDIRDRAIIALITETEESAESIANLMVKDFEVNGDVSIIRINQTGKNERLKNISLQTTTYINSYITKANIVSDTHAPLFRSITRGGKLKTRAISRDGISKMIKKRLESLGNQISLDLSTSTEHPESSQTDTVSPTTTILTPTSLISSKQTEINKSDNLHPPLRSDDISVWLIEDDLAYQRLVVQILEKTPGIQCTFVSSRCEPAIERIRYGDKPDVILMDISLAGEMDGIEGTWEIKELHNDIFIAPLTNNDDDRVITSSIFAGADGYLLKPSSPQEITTAIRDFSTNGVPVSPQIAKKMMQLYRENVKPNTYMINYSLSSREMEILDLLTNGKTKKESAYLINISEHTVDTHIRSIYKKLGVRNRSAAVIKALKEGIVQLN